MEDYGRSKNLNEKIRINIKTLLQEFKEKKTRRVNEHELHHDVVEQLCQEI